MLFKKKIVFIYQKTEELLTIHAAAAEDIRFFGFFPYAFDCDGADLRPIYEFLYGGQRVRLPFGRPFPQYKFCFGENGDSVRGAAVFIQIIRKYGKYLVLLQAAAIIASLFRRAVL